MRVLHVRAPESPRLIADSPARSNPLPCPLVRPRLALLLSERQRCCFGGIPAPVTGSAMDGAARATLARQLTPGAVPARQLASAAIPSLDASRCKLQRGGSPILSSVAAVLILGAAEPT
jgi:hypothetical protein